MAKEITLVLTELEFKRLHFAVKEYRHMMGKGSYSTDKLLMNRLVDKLNRIWDEITKDESQYKLPENPGPKTTGQ